MPRKNRPRAVKEEPVKPRPSLSQNWIIVFILGITFAAFANSIGNGFAYDDETQIVRNASIRSFSSIPLVLTKESWFWRVLQDRDPNKQEGPTTPYYRPLVMIYLMIGWSLFHQSPAGWHLFNILFHLVSVYFVFRILLRVTGESAVAAVATILFAVHPLRVESVAWVSGVTDLITASLMLPSFYLYLLFRERSSTKYLIGSISLFVLALFAKEPAIMLPIFICLYELLVENQDQPFKSRIKPALRYSTRYLVMSLPYFAMRVHALGYVLNDKGFASYPLHEVLLTIPLVIWKYLGLFFWPLNLTLFHGTPMVQSVLSIRFLLPMLGLVALGLGLWQLRGSRNARFAILWVVVNMLPILNLGAFIWEFNVQERYLYIPSIGISVLLAMAFLKLPIEKWFTLGSRATARSAVIVLVTVLFVVKSVSQNSVWADDMKLWQYGVEAAPDQTMPYFILGHKFLNRQQMDGVIENLEKYMDIDPTNIIVINNLAAAHLVAYQTQAASNPAAGDRTHIQRVMALCDKALAINPNGAQSWDTLGTAFTYETEFKNLDKAIGCFERALSSQPQNAMFRFHLGATMFKRNAVDDSIRELEQVRQTSSDIPDVYKFLAYAYKAKGKLREASDNFDRYLQSQPNAADAASVRATAEEVRTQLKNGQPQS